MKQFDPLADEARELAKLKLTLRSIDTPFARSNGLGEIRKLELENQVEDVATTFNLQSRPNPDLIFNSEFLPPRAERLPRAQP